MDCLDKRYKKSDNVVFRNIADEMILVPIRNKTGDLQNIYTLNEVAARIWELLDGEKTTLQIRDAVVGEFEVGAEEAERDLKGFLETLESVEAIEEGKA